MMPGVWGSLHPFWLYPAIFAWVVVSAWASGHAILSRRDAQSALSWTGFIWLAPLFGAFCYVAIGINRVRRRADRLRGDVVRYRVPSPESLSDARRVVSAFPERVRHLGELTRLVQRVTTRPLTGGNCVEVFESGDAAYPKMLSAIDGAEHSVWLLSYIFEDSEIGRRFVEALGEAKRRGVDVKVLIDDAGSPDTRIDRRLSVEGVVVARFLPVRVSHRVDHFNLRNHRKILVVDGRVGFTGGLNVAQGHVLESRPRWPVRDTHFGFEGPVVRHFQEVFAEDWRFTTGEDEDGLRLPVPPEVLGPVYARGIAEGPDEDFDTVRLAILGALACARESIAIVSPYFLPDQSLATALKVAGLRGIVVDVVLPVRSDVRIVDYASRAQLWQILGDNVRVWLSPLPFDHSKLMVVDGYWSFVGSANWDPRSLRLNFEFNVECYDAELARKLRTLIDSRIAESTQVTEDALDAQPLWARLRNGICRLFKPYI